MIAITKSGANLVFTDDTSGEVTYLNNPTFTYKAGIVNQTFDSIIFRSGEQLKAVNATSISTINAVAPGNTPALIMAKLSALLDTTSAPAIPTGAATAARQDTGNTALAAINTALGDPGVPVSATDTGTVPLLSMFKRALTNWTSLLAKIPAYGQANKANSLPVVLASDSDSLAISPGNSSITHTAATITTGGISQVAVTSQAARKYLLIQNVSDTNMYIRLDGVAATPTNGLLLPANGSSWESPAHWCPVGAVSILCANAGKAFITLTN